MSEKTKEIAKLVSDISKATDDVCSMAVCWADGTVSSRKLRNSVDRLNHLRHTLAALRDSVQGETVYDCPCCVGTGCSNCGILDTPHEPDQGEGHFNMVCGVCGGTGKPLK